MKRKLETSEMIFKVISYTLLCVFALACLYPFVYAVSASVSGAHAVDYCEIVLFPKDPQFDAFARMFNDNMFWNSYSNTNIYSDYMLYINSTCFEIYCSWNLYSGSWY